MNKMIRVNSQERKRRMNFLPTSKIQTEVTVKNTINYDNVPFNIEHVKKKLILYSISSAAK